MESPNTKYLVRSLALSPAALGGKECTLLLPFAHQSDEDAIRAEPLG